MAITREWEWAGHYLEATYLYSLKMQKKRLWKTLKEQCQICREKYWITLPYANVEELVPQGAIMYESRHILVLSQDFLKQQRLGLSWGIKAATFMVHILKHEISIMCRIWWHEGLGFIAASSILVTYAESSCFFLARSLLALSHVSPVKINSTNCHFFYH